MYKLICKENNKFYIGKAVNLHNRLNDHRYSEHRPVKGKYPIQSAIVKYGWDSFTVEILYIFQNFDKLKNHEELLQKESYYIDLFDSTNKLIGYNVLEFSVDRTGQKNSEEHRKKISDYHKGRPKSKEHAAKCRIANLGKKGPPKSKESLEQSQKTRLRNIELGKKRKPLSDETKKRMGLAKRGTKMSEEAKRKISESNKGKPKSKEHVEKCRLGNLGRKASDETKLKMSLAHKGRKLSEEHKQILIQCNKDRVISEETREKMRKSQMGKGNNKGNTATKETREKMRISRLAYVEKQKLENIQKEKK